LRGRGLELGREVAVTRVGVHEVDVFVQREDFAAGVVEFGAPVWRAGLIGLGGDGGGVEAVLFTTEGAVCVEDLISVVGLSNCLRRRKTYIQQL
jgi:hypothetical protein